MYPWSPSPVQPMRLRTLKVETRNAGFCDGCTRGYHAGERVAIDAELRVLHPGCYAREKHLGGHMPAYMHRLAQQERRSWL